MIATILTVCIGIMSSIVVLSMFSIYRKVKKNPDILFEEESVEMKLFEVLGYDSYAEEYFSEMFSKKKTVANRRQRKYMLKTCFWGAIAVACNYWPLAAVVGAFYFSVAMMDKTLMEYYFSRYFEVDISLEKIDEESDDE